MTDEFQPKTAFSFTQWLMGVLSVLLLALLTLLVGWFASQRASSEQFTHDADMLLRQIGEHVVETRGVLKSMLGMHYASDEFAGADIEAFAEQLRTYSPFVQAIGMFGLVEGQMLRDYEHYVADITGEPFSVHGWDSNGQMLEFGSLSEKATLWPVNLIDPMDQVGRSFLGTELGTVPSIGRTMDSLVRSGEGILIPMPAGWPLDGQAVLLQPVFASAQPPDSESDRLESVAGGIWVAIDLNQVMGSALEALPYARLTFRTALKDRNEKQIFTIDSRSEGHGIDLGFGDAQAKRRWEIGQSHVEILLSAPLLANYTHLVMVTVAVALVSLLACAVLIITHLHREQHLERKRGRQALTAEREKARFTLQSLSHPVLTLDHEYRCVYLNPAAEKNLAISSTTVVGQLATSFLQLREDHTNHALELESVCLSLSEGGHREMDVQIDMDDSLDSTWSMTLTRIAASNLDKQGYILVLQDVSKERNLTSELEHRAHHDALTGTYNRFYFERRLQELVQDLVPSGRKHALCYIDLDQFKIVNDTCGHAAGDRLLCELTDALLQITRQSDVFARLGGDEFGVLLTDISLDQAKMISQKIHKHFQNAAFEHEGQVFPVRASMGLVEIGGINRDIKQIMKAADLACYAAKDGGRNALVVYSPEDELMNERQEEMNWLPVLEKALIEDGFELLLQPISSVDCQSHISHYECLLRLVDEEGKLVTPHRFIRAAERYDLMRDIDRWVVNRAMLMMQEWDRKIDASVGFSINLSGQSAADPELPGFIESAIQRHGADPTRLWFEITETAAITHFFNAIKLIEAVHQLGARVALDDFGTGLSSFAYLRDLPVDVLKIDGQFVKDIANCSVSREMVRAMHQVAKAMRLSTVAEFVEDEQILAELDDIGIDFAQGWHIGRPESLTTIVSALQRKQDRAA